MPLSGGDADNLGDLIVHAYRQAEQDPDLRRQCLDLFDWMLEVGSYRADDAIEAFSRVWQNSMIRAPGSLRNA